MTTTQKTEFALLNSGATENFLDPRTVERLRLPIQKLSEPRIIYNIDGTLVTGKATLTLEQDSYSRPLAFGTGILSMGAGQSRFSDRRLNLPS